MDILQNDDEFLLKELERRDGIYSFIFKELEASKFQSELEEKSHQIKADMPENKECQWIINDLNTRQTVEKSLISSATACIGTPCSSKTSLLYGDAIVKYSVKNFQESWQSNFNKQFQRSFKTSSFPPSFQQFDCLHSLNVRKAKSPFPHIHAPLVRNRRHEFKETKEYKNFMNGSTQVADLRELFPLDPDVHAPFKELKENVREAKFGGLLAKDQKCLK